MDKEEGNAENQPVISINTPEGVDDGHGIDNSNDAINKIDRKAMPFAWIALVSSILVLAWNSYWALWYLVSRITDSCVGTSCGEALAWSLIFGTFGNGIIMIPQLLFGPLSWELKAKNNRLKNIMLLVTLILTILSFLLVIIAWIYTFIHSH